MQNGQVLVVAATLIVGGAAHAQVVQFDIDISGEVNGGSLAAMGGGELDLDQEGRSNAELVFSELPETFNPITASLISNLCGNAFVEGNGTDNLATLSAGDYEVSRTLQWTGASGGMTVETVVTSEREGNWNAQTIVQGSYNGPTDVVGVLDYVVTWIPSSTPGEFFEAATAVLLREGGETFALQIASVYTGLSGSLSERQFGRGSFDVGFDGTTLTYGWDGAFTQVPAPGPAALLALAGFAVTRRRR